MVSNRTSLAPPKGSVSLIDLVLALPTYLFVSSPLHLHVFLGASELPYSPRINPGDILLAYLQDHPNRAKTLAPEKYSRTPKRKAQENARF